MNPERILLVDDRELKSAIEIALHKRSSEMENRRMNREEEIALFEEVSLNIAAAPVSIEDDTRRRRGEEALRESEEMYSSSLQTRMVESISQLAGSVAHDVNNILAAILMHLGVLQGDPNLSPITRTAIKELELHAERAAGLTRQLLLFSRRSVVQMKTVDVNDLVVPDRDSVGMSTLEAPGGKETILLVEDDASLRRTLGTYLQSKGYQVLEAANGKEALSHWEQRHGRIDLLFTDMIMPEGMTGMDLARQLRKHKPALPVIISSGYSPDLIAKDANAPGGFTYLSKPCSPLVLALAIRRCLDKTG